MKPPLGVPGAVEGAAGDVELLEDGDVGPGHAPVADEEGGRQQGADARADEVGAALGHVGRRGGVVVGVQAQVVVDEGVAVGRDGAGPLAVAFGAGHGLSFGSSRWAVSVNAGAAAVGRCGRSDSRPAGAGVPILSELINPPTICFKSKFPINTDATIAGIDININSSMNWVTILILFIPIDKSIPIS